MGPVPKKPRVFPGSPRKTQSKEEVEKRLETYKKDIKVAVMGCVVNGPGEAREADIGIAGGIGEGIIFKKGKIIKKVKEEELVDALMEEIEKLCADEKSIHL